MTKLNIDLPVLYQRIEAAAVLAATLFFTIHLHYNIWAWAFGSFLVDISAVGYILNRTAGAYLYNFGHSFIGPAVLMIIGVPNHSGLLIQVSLFWLTHVAFDRMMGYGLKYTSGFNDTHLGIIGKNI